MGASALCLAVAGAAFSTHLTTATTDYFFQQTDGGSYVKQAYVTGGTPLTVNLGCIGGPRHCMGKFTGYLTNLTGTTRTSWSPVLSTLVESFGQPF